MLVEIILKIPKEREKTFICEWFVYLDGAFGKHSMQLIEDLNLERVERLEAGELERFAGQDGYERLTANRPDCLYYRDKEPDWLIDQYLESLGGPAPKDE